MLYVLLGIFAAAWITFIATAFGLFGRDTLAESAAGPFAALFIISGLGWVSATLRHTSRNVATFGVALAVFGSLALMLLPARE